VREAGATSGYPHPTCAAPGGASARAEAKPPPVRCVQCSAAFIQKMTLIRRLLERDGAATPHGWLPRKCSMGQVAEQIPMGSMTRWSAVQQFVLQPRRASGASGAGRLDACVRQPILGRINLPRLKRLTRWLKPGNFLPFRFLPDLCKASDGLHRIQAFASKTTLHTFVRFYHGYPVLAQRVSALPRNCWVQPRCGAQQSNVGYNRLLCRAPILKRHADLTASLSAKHFVRSNRSNRSRRKLNTADFALNKCH
jgi:hypothetical protein